MPKGVLGSNVARCGVKGRRSGGPCQHAAGWGTPHVGSGPCKIHGGCLPNVIKHHQDKLLDADAKLLFGQIVDETPVTNPLPMFAELAGKVMGWMRTFDKLTRDLDSPRYAGMTGEQIRGEVQLFERAMDRANNVLATYARLNIDDRLARITEAQQQMVVNAIEAALNAANVTGQQAIEAKKAAARQLRIVA